VLCLFSTKTSHNLNLKALITILVFGLPIYTLAQSTKTVNPKIVESVKGESDNIFFGSYLGLGANFVPFVKGSVGFDMVAAVSPKFAVGTFVGYQTVASGSVGINFIFGEHTNQDAFYLGLGANVNGDRGFFLTRIGARSSRRRKLFPFVELGLGNGGNGGIFSLNLGYNL